MQPLLENHSSRASQTTNAATPVTSPDLFVGLDSSLRRLRLPDDGEVLEPFAPETEVSVVDTPGTPDSAHPA